MDFALALLAGGLVVLSMTINSGLGLRVGVLRATAVNYAVGLAGVAVLALAGTALPPSPVTVGWWAWTGGLLGVAIVTASNIVLPRIPVVAATVLMTLGQLATGLVFDALRAGVLDGYQIAGATLVLAGALLSQKR